MRRLTGWLVFRGNRPFSWLWWSESVSLFGSQVTLVAIPLLAALTLGASALDMGILAAVESAPYLLLSIPAGFVADRVDRRRLLILSNLARALLLLAIPVSAILGALSLPLLVVISFLIGTCSVVFDVAYQTYVPDLLPPEDLLAGNQRLELSESAARTIGPGLGGALVAATGGAAAIVVDAVSYFLASIALLRARTARQPAASQPEPEPPPARPRIPVDREPSIGLLVEIWEYVSALEERLAAVEGRLSRKTDSGWRSAFAGLGVVFRDRLLRDVAISTATFNLASAAISAVFVLYAATELGMDPVAIGTLLAGGNVGFVIGALAVGAVTARLGVGRVVAMSTVIGAIATVILPFAVGTGAVALLFIGRFLGALTIPLYNVNALALRQTRAPRETLGRVNAIFRMLDWGALPVGALLGGYIGAVYGLRVTLVVAAGLGILSAIWLVASPVRRLRHLGTDEATQPAAGQSPRSLLGRPSLAGPSGAVGWSLSFVGRLPRIEWAPLAIAAALVQVAIFMPAVSVHLASAPPFLYVLSSAAVLACVLRNARIPGLIVAALGGLSNLLAVVANGGYMPVDPSAARAVGHTPPIGYVNTVELANPHLKPLTDIIAVPPPLPFANVYSLGDLLIVIGIAVAVFWTLGRGAPDEGGARTPAGDSTPLPGTASP
jgi:MFS family permease